MGLLRPLLTVAGLASAGGYARAIWRGDQGASWMKPIPALSMAGRVALDRRGAYDALVAAGLVASAVGDRYLDQGEEAFLKGVGAFFAAHVLYIAAYEQDRGPLHPGRGLAAYGVAGGILGALWPRLPTALRPGLATYAGAIATMLWRATARADADATWDRKVGAGGAALFVISDALIGLTRFSGDQGRGARLAIILLYWLGQLGIASSASRRS